MASKIQILIDAKDQFSKTFGEAQTAAKSLGSSLSSLAGPIKTMGISVAAAGTAAAAVGTALYAMTSSAAEAQSELGNFASRLGISVEHLSSYELAAKNAGVESDNVRDAIQDMSEKIGEASYGMGETAEALMRMGMSYQDFAGLKPEEQFEKMVRALADVEDANVKVTLANQLFADSGNYVLQIIGKDGPDAFLKYAKSMRDNGIAVTEEGYERSREFIKAQKELNTSFIKVKGTIASALMPTITELATKFTTAMNEFRKNTLKKWAENVGKALKEIDWGKVEKGFGDVTGKIEKLWDFLSEHKEVLKFGIIGLALFGKERAMIVATAALVSEGIASVGDALREHTDASLKAGKSTDRLLSLFRMVGIDTSKVKIKTEELSDSFQKALPDLDAYINKMIGVSDSLKMDTGAIPPSIKPLEPISPGDGIDTKLISDTQRTLIAGLREQWSTYYEDQNKQIDIWAENQIAAVKREAAESKMTAEGKAEAIRLIEETAAAKKDALRQKQKEDMDAEKKAEKEKQDAILQANTDALDSIHQAYVNHFGTREEQIALQQQKELDALQEKHDAIMEMEGLSNEQRLEQEEAFQTAKDELNAEFDELRAEKKLEDSENELLSFEERQAALDVWHQREIDAHAGKEDEIDRINKEYAKRQMKLDKQKWDTRINQANVGATALIQMASVFGVRQEAIQKAFRIKDTIMSTYNAAMNSYNALAGIPIIGPALGAAAAAAAIAYGMQQVGNIAAAHGGLDYVPKEQTYLLDRGERVLSPRQNRDLTDYMSGATSTSTNISIDNFTMAVNVPNADALVNMTSTDWEMIAQERIFPAFQKLAMQGQTI